MKYIHILSKHVKSLQDMISRRYKNINVKFKFKKISKFTVFFLEYD